MVSIVPRASGYRGLQECGYGLSMTRCGTSTWNFLCFSCWPLKPMASCISPPLQARSRMRRTTMILLAIISSAHPADAQVSGNELSAAYCLGVFEQREKDGLASRLGEEAARQQVQTLGRLHQYLKIKIGTKTSSSHLRTLFAVKESGTRDQSECMSGIEANFATEACKRVTQCKPAPLSQPSGPAPADRVAPLEALQDPAQTASQPRRQSVSNATSSQSQSQ